MNCAEMDVIAFFLLKKLYWRVAVATNLSGTEYWERYAMLSFGLMYGAPRNPEDATDDENGCTWVACVWV